MKNNNAIKTRIDMNHQIDLYIVLDHWCRSVFKCEAPIKTKVREKFSTGTTYIGSKPRMYVVTKCQKCRYCKINNLIQQILKILDDD